MVVGHNLSAFVLCVGNGQVKNSKISKTLETDFYKVFIYITRNIGNSRNETLENVFPEVSGLFKKSEFLNWHFSPNFQMTGSVSE